MNKIVNTFINNIDKLEEITDYLISLSDETNFPTDKKNKYDINEIINISKDFLKTIDEKYLIDFDNKLNNGTIVTFDANDTTINEFEYTDDRPFVKKYIRTKGYELDENDEVLIKENHTKEIINIPRTQEITDAYNMIHEYFHSVTLNESNLSSLFSESCSIIMEYTLLKYLESNNYNHNEIYDEIDFRYKMLIFIANNINKQVKEYKKDTEFSSKIDDKIINNLNNYLPYLIGDLYGICFYNDLCNNKTSINNAKLFINTISNGDKIEYLDEYENDFETNIIDYINSSKEESINFLIDKINENKNVKSI